MNEELCKFLLGCMFAIAIFAASCQSRAEDWDTVSKVEFGTFIALQAIDVAQTKRALAQPDLYVEANPIFGHHPKIGTIIAVKLLATGGVYYVADRMSVNERRWLLGILDVVSFSIDQHNASIGLGWSF
jgi:hypothetical protein